MKLREARGPQRLRKLLSRKTWETLSAAGVALAPRAGTQSAVGGRFPGRGGLRGAGYLLRSIFSACDRARRTESPRMGAMWALAGAGVLLLLLVLHPAPRPSPGEPGPGRPGCRRLSAGRETACFSGRRRRGSGDSAGPGVPTEAPGPEYPCEILEFWSSNF